MDEMLVVIGALHRRIIPPDFCIDDALAALPAEEARIAKRKFRKMVRKMRNTGSTSGGKWVTIPSSARRRMVRKECHRTGLALVETKEDKHE